MSREGDYYKCSKKQPVVCREKVTITSVARAVSGTSREGDYYKCSNRQPVVCREKVTTTSVVRGGHWYFARR